MEYGALSLPVMLHFRGDLSSGLYNGADSASNYSGWYGYWPAGFGLTNYVTFVRGRHALLRISFGCTVANYFS
jgi:hypothetical protein